MQTEVSHEPLRCFLKLRSRQESFDLSSSQRRRVCLLITSLILPLITAVPPVEPQVRLPSPNARNTPESGECLVFHIQSQHLTFSWIYSLTSKQRDVIWSKFSLIHRWWPQLDNKSGALPPVNHSCDWQQRFHSLPAGRTRNKGSGKDVCSRWNEIGHKRGVY